VQGLRGLSLSARQRSTPPKKTRTRPSRAPRARGVHAPTAGATATPGALAASAPVGATHVAAVPGTPAVCVEASSTRPTSVRPAAGLRRCVGPPHVSTRPLPTRAERFFSLPRRTESVLCVTVCVCGWVGVGDRVCRAGRPILSLIREPPSSLSRPGFCASKALQRSKQRQYR
jgi:hypothetical protein